MPLRLPGGAGPGRREVENPEEELTITALDRGSLVHEVLESFLAGVLDRPRRAAGPTRPGRRRIATACWRSPRQSVTYEARGLVGRPVFWRRPGGGSWPTWCVSSKRTAAHRGQFGTPPVAAELAFGLEGRTSRGRPPPARRAPGPFPGQGGPRRRGRRRDARGRRLQDRQVRRYAGLSEDDPDARGTKLQLPVYGQAARLHQDAPDAPVRSEYWFTSARGGFNRIGYPVTTQVLERVGATVGLMAAAIEDGVFPPHPTATSTSPFVECPYCDPDALGVVDLRRQIDRKRRRCPARHVLGSGRGHAGSGRRRYRGRR